MTSNDSRMIERSLSESSWFGYINHESDTRYCMDDFGDCIEIPFCSPSWATQDYEEI